MAETVNDILGKGFKFENRVGVETLTEDKLTGTTPAIIGGAHWGPVNIPTLVKKSFKSFFGDPVIADNSFSPFDFAGLAAEYYLKYSQYLYFTRVTDGTDKAASRILKKEAKVAQVNAKVATQNTSVTIYPKGAEQNNIFVVKYNGGVKVVKLPASLSAKGAVDISTVQTASLANKTILFTIDNILVTYTITGSETNLVESLRNALATKFNITQTEADAYIYALTVDNISYTNKTFENNDVIQIGNVFYKYNGTSFAALTVETGTEFPDSPTNGDYFYDTNTHVLSLYTTSWATVTFEIINYVMFNSQKYGKSSIIEIHDFPGTTITETNPTSFLGSDSSINTLVEYIKTKFTETISATGDGLYLKTAGSWGSPLTTTIYGTIPASPSDGELYKSDGSTSAMPYGWYKYSTAQAKWVAVGYIELGSIVPDVSYGSNGDYFEVADSAPILTSQLNIGFDSLGRITIATKNSGLSQSFTLCYVDTFGANVILGFEDGLAGKTYTGVDEKIGGRIDAKYSGERGNEIFFKKTVDVNGYSLSAYIGSYLIGKFYNYSYQVASDEFIGTLINTDTIASKFITLSVESGATEIPEFEVNKEIYLLGGTSGLTGLNDEKYIAVANDYKNVDLYDIDLIAAPGIVSEKVIDALIDVCEYRMDCMVIMDPIQGASESLVRRWHNGETSQRTKIDSEYAALYYPWLLIPVNSKVKPKQWVPPTVRVIGAFGSCDIINSNKYSVTAGYKNATLYDVEAIEKYMQEEVKQELYSDILQNNINPIVYTKKYGFFIDGQKTTKRGLTPINRIKVMRTAFYIKRCCYELAPEYFWLPITGRTQARLYDDLNDIAKTLVDVAIKPDYKITTDESINTEVIEASNGLIGMIEWSPLKSVERLKIINVIKDKQVSVQLLF